jgi:hypothetical protein
MMGWSPGRVNDYNIAGVMVSVLCQHTNHYTSDVVKRLKKEKYEINCF